MILMALVFFSTYSFFKGRGYLSPLSGFIAVILLLPIGILLYKPIDEILLNSRYLQESEFLRELITEYTAGLVTVLCAFIASKVAPASNPRNTNKRKSQLPYQILSISAYSVSAAALIMSAIIRHEDGGQSGFALMTAVFLGIGVELGRMAKRARLQCADDAINTSTKAPVLYLRSFALGKEAIPEISPSIRASTKKLEDILGPVVKEKFGPLVALGDPDDYLPSTGAYKVYQTDDDWQPKFKEYCNLSMLILLVEGQTQGLHWEIDHIRRSQDPRKIFVLTEPQTLRGKCKANTNSDKWVKFQALAKDSNLALPLNDPGPGSVIAFDDSWEPIVVKTGIRKGIVYAAAIEQAFSSKTKVR
jgi:hypothetical protein